MKRTSAGKSPSVKFRAVRARRSEVREPAPAPRGRPQRVAAVPGAAVPASRRSGLTRQEVAVLKRGGVEERSFATVRPAVRRAAELFQILLRDGLTVDEAARRLAVDASRIRQRLAARTLYGIKVGGEWRLPLFQFRPDGSPVPGIEAVTRALAADLSPVAVWRWLTAPNVDLVSRAGEEETLTPLEWLETGHSPNVAAALAAEL